jgi:hypothetical protein
LDSPVIEGGPDLPYGGEREISLVGDFAYMNSVVPSPDSEEFTTSLLRIPLKSPGKWEVEEDHVLHHAVDGEGSLYFVRIDWDGDVGEIKRVSGKKKEVVQSFENINDRPVLGVAASDRYLVWSVENELPGCQSATADPLISPGTCEGWIGVKDLKTGEVSAIQLQSDGAKGLSVSGHFLAWGNGSGYGDAREYLFNLETGQATILGEARGCSYAAVAGEAVAWRTDRDADGKRADVPPYMLGFLKDSND